MAGPTSFIFRHIAEFVYTSRLQIWQTFIKILKVLYCITPLFYFKIRKRLSNYLSNKILVMKLMISSMKDTYILRYNIIGSLVHIYQFRINVS